MDAFVVALRRRRRDDVSRVRVGQGRVALGQRSGCRVMRIGSDPNSPWVTSRTPLQAHLEGFDLHAAVSVGGDDRARLERLYLYILRPPVAQNHLELKDDGRVLLG